MLCGVHNFEMLWFLFRAGKRCGHYLSSKMFKSVMMVRLMKQERFSCCTLDDVDAHIRTGTVIAAVSSKNNRGSHWIVYHKGRLLDPHEDAYTTETLEIIEAILIEDATPNAVELEKMNSALCKAKGLKKQCRINGENIRLCETMQRCLTEPHRLGVACQNIFNLETGKVVRSVVTLRSGEFKKNGICLNYCPFCGSPLYDHKLDSSVTGKEKLAELKKVNHRLKRLNK